MTNHIAKYENYWTNDIGMDELTDEKNERTGRRTIYTDTIVRGAYNYKHNYVFNKSIAFVINVTFDNAVWNPTVSLLKSFYFDKLEVYTYFWFNPTLCMIFLVWRKVSHTLIIKQNFSKSTYLIARLLIFNSFMAVDCKNNTIEIYPI